jgi:membrane-associated protease RseP (regulator of RpoE activity)
VTVLLYIGGVLLFILGLAASIGLHEFGHLIPAKKFGVKVPRYFVGFGPTVFSRQIGETEYGVKAIPLGGYVKLVGMLPPASERNPDRREGWMRTLIADAREAEMDEIKPGDEGRLFYQLSTWKKLVTMAGGPITNLLIAYALFAAYFGFYGTIEPSSSTVIGSVSACAIPATEGGRACKASDPVSPAQAAGFKQGDKMISFNGTSVKSWDQLTPLIRANGGDQAEVVVERGGSTLTLHPTTTVSLRPDLKDTTKYVNVGFLGVSPLEVQVTHGLGYTTKQMGVFVSLSAKALVQMPVKLYGVARTALGLQPRDREGPMSVVGAGRVAGEIASTPRGTASDKLASLMMLLASLNLFLGLFNLVPLLPLDGGHMAGAIYEGIKRRLARLVGRPDPGHVDVARLLPVAYVVGAAFIVMSLLLIYVDIVAPISLS